MNKHKDRSNILRKLMAVMLATALILSINTVMFNFTFVSAEEADSTGASTQSEESTSGAGSTEIDDGADSGSDSDDNDSETKSDGVDVDEVGTAEMESDSESGEDIINSVEDGESLLLFSTGAGNPESGEESSSDGNTDAGSSDTDSSDEKAEDNSGNDSSDVNSKSDSERDKKKVKLKYTKKIYYEDYHTHNFKVTCDGETKVAYCIQPQNRRLAKKKYTAKSYDNELMRKALYYSYGYPGYETKMKDYLKGKDRKSCYKGDSGAYVLSHLMLSYVYSKEGKNSNAFKGVGSGGKKLVKNMLKKVKSWDDPPSKGSSISLSDTELTTEWDSELKMQSTDDITVGGSDGNSITFTVPDNMKLSKRSESDEEESYEEGDNVNLAVGDDFSLAAPASEEGTYESPKLEGSVKAFEAYIITKSGRQDVVFGVSESDSVSFKVKWGTFWSEDISISTSAAEKESGKNTFTAGGEAIITDTVKYEGLTEGLEYTVKGKLMDKETGESAGDYSGEAVFSPDSSEGSVNVEFTIDSDALVGKTLVVFEKLYYGDKLLASHEDINDTAQAVSVTESEGGEEDKDTEGNNNNSDNNYNDTTENTDSSNNTNKSSVSTSGSSSSGSPKTEDTVALASVVAALIVSALTGIMVLRRRKQ